MRRRRAHVAALIAIAACDPARNPTIAPPTIRDSAGIRIVEHATIRDVPVAFTIDERPDIDIGGEASRGLGELRPNAFPTMRPLRGGQFVIPDVVALKVYDSASKRYVRTIWSGPGTRPSDFEQLENVCVIRGDTLIAWDHANRRVNVFDSAHKFVRSFVATGAVTHDGCMKDGSLLTTTGSMGNPASELPPHQAKYLDPVMTLSRVSGDGAAVGVVTTIPGASDASFMGLGNAAPWHDSVYTGNGRTAEIRVYTTRGALTRIVRWNDAPRRVTDADVRALAQSRVGDPPKAGELDYHIAQIRGLGVPATAPAFHELKVDPLGRLWISSFQMKPDDDVSWTVLDRDGALLGRLELSARASGRDSLTLREVGAEHIVVNWYDPSGSIHVALHRLRGAR